MDCIHLHVKIMIHTFIQECVAKVETFVFFSLVALKLPTLCRPETLTKMKKTWSSLLFVSFILSLMILPLNVSGHAGHVSIKIISLSYLRNLFSTALFPHLPLVSPALFLHFPALPLPVLSHPSPFPLLLSSHTFSLLSLSQCIILTLSSHMYIVYNYWVFLTQLFMYIMKVVVLVGHLQRLLWVLGCHQEYKVRNVFQLYQEIYSICGHL